MKKVYLLSAILCFVCTFPLNAQLKVASTGKVGIKIGTADPLAYLSIGGAGLSNTAFYSTFSANPNSSGYGIYSNLFGGMSDAKKYSIVGVSKANHGSIIGVQGEAGAITTTSLQIARMFGVYGIAGGATNGKNYGVCGILQTGSSNGAGVYGSNNDTIQTLSERYAGYFRGKTYVNGDFYYTALHQTSDARLKTNITSIKQDALQKLNDLRPVQFQWKQKDDIVVEDTTTIRTPHFSEDIDFEQKHYGFLAQDVQKLYPELVQEDGNGYMSVNYVELIPLLIQSIQDLSVEVEELKAQNNPQQAPRRAPASEDSADHQAVLYQNNPNPFSIDTEIGYLLPTNMQSATLYVYNMNGTQVADYPIHSFGAGSVTITAGHLEAGMYLYSLIADGQVVDTKRMILTK